MIWAVGSGHAQKGADLIHYSTRLLVTTRLSLLLVYTEFGTAAASRTKYVRYHATAKQPQSALSVVTSAHVRHEVWPHYTANGSDSEAIAQPMVLVVLAIW